MDQKVEIKKEPVWREGTGNYSLENFELVSGMIPLKQETKSELTEPGPTHEDAFELAQEVKGEIFIEEHAVDQTVPSIEEENNAEVSELTRRPVFSCASCSRLFKTRSMLKRHLLTHSGEKPYQCTECSFQFSQKCSLQRHKLTHSGEKPYSCKFCSSTFSQKGDVKKHEFTHTGEKPYRCLECNNAFSRKFTLKVHLLSHAGERPYCCTVCKSDFTRLAHLKSHLLSHSGEGL